MCISSLRWPVFLEAARHFLTRTQLGGHISIGMTPRLGRRMLGLEALSCSPHSMIQADIDGPAQEAGRDMSISQRRGS